MCYPALGSKSSRQSTGNKWCKNYPNVPRYAKRYVCQPLILVLVAAVVILPTAYVFIKHQRAVEASKSRISCLEGEDASSESACLAAGCLWSSDVDTAPHCYYPPASSHGYRVLAEAPTATGYTLTLGLLETSAAPVPDLKDQLTVELLEYTDDLFRIKITVPGEARYEVPVPLQLPPLLKAGPGARRYNVSYRLDERSDVFAIRVTRAATGTVIFDSSIGGLTYGSQFLQVATKLPLGASLYGLGEHAHPSFMHTFDWSVWPMFSRDQAPNPGLQINLYGVQPVYYVLEDKSNAHAVLWLNSNAMEVEMIPLPGLALRSIGGIVDLLFMMGPSPSQTVEQFTELVGRPMLPPYWALGFQLCRYGYVNLEDIQRAVTRTRRHGVPQDVQYGDIDMMDRQLDFTVDTVSFAGLPDYIREVKEEGLRFVVILDPAINAELGDEYPVHQRAMADDVYIKWGPEHTMDGDNFGAGDVMLGYVWPENRTAFPDFLRAGAADWWAQEIELFHQEVAFDGLWIDMNEPANFGTNDDHPWNWPEAAEEDWSLHCNTSEWDDPPYRTRAVGENRRLSEKTLCMSAVQGSSRQYRHYDVHSLYGWAQSLPTLQALQQSTGRRGLVISRSTFPSSGRWAGHWLGDNTADWGHLRHSVVGMLEFNLFGIPYIGADICGFFSNTTEELCGRWMQLGAFYPYSRNHNGLGYMAQDPGRWPSVGAVGRTALRLRYLLLPHLYTLHYHAHQHAQPVVRSLAFEFPQDVNSRDLDTEFMWGSSLLVAPVLYEGASSVNVHFPPAGRWYDFHKGFVAANVARTVTISAPLSGGKVPVFVRQGAILPTQRPAANTKQSRSNPLGLLVAPTADGWAEGDLFWDDGETIDSTATGDYYAASFYYNQSMSALSWTVTHPSPASVQDLVFSDGRVFAVYDRPYQLLLNGASVQRGSWHYDDLFKVLEVHDLAVPVAESFVLSWTSDPALPLPCPMSYKDWNETMEVTEAKCTENNCIWSEGSKVPCALPGPSSHGYTIAGALQPTESGYTVPLHRLPAPKLFSTPIEDVTFEVIQLSNEVLRFKLYDSNNDRYEVPMPITPPLPSLDSPLYEVHLASEQQGEVFAFSVVRTSTQSVIFDTRLGGLTLEDQFLTLTTLLPSNTVYGLGENNHPTFRRTMDGTTWGIFARDNKHPLNEQSSLSGAHPFYECIENDGSSHGVALLNSNAMEYQFLPYPALTLRTIGGVLDFLLMLGPSPEEVVAQHTRLMGRPALPPYWALGFHLSRNGYENLDQIREVVNRTRDLQIPQDVQYVDMEHMERQKVFTLDQQKFVELPQYVEELHQQGMRFMLPLHPAINAELSDEDYPTHSRAMQSNVYTTWADDTLEEVVDLNNGGLDMIMLGYHWPENRTAFPSWHQSATQTWWEEEISLFRQTVPFDGVTLDFNEPSVFDTNLEQPWNWPDWQNQSWNLVCPKTVWDDPPYVTKAGSVGPSYRLSDQTLCLDAMDGPYRHYDVHNLNGWAQARATLGGVQSATAERGLVVGRASFLGSGQWAGHWLWDNNSDWPDMRASIIGMLEYNLFGIPFVGAAVCGYRGSATEELCGRWMQLGAFYPYSRNHNALGETDQDPGSWNATVGPWSRSALLTRYRLLPYLYTLFYQATKQGGTVARPLVHEFPGDRNSHSVDDQFLWGSGLMISPVLEQGVTERSAYFPHAAWYDYYTGEPILWPGENIVIDAPLDTIPLHVRGGSILPIQEPSLTTQASQGNPTGLLVALDLNRRASGSLFWDSLAGIDTIANHYSLVVFTFVEDTLTMTVDANHQEDLGQLKLRDLEFYGIEQEPTGLVLNGGQTSNFPGTRSYSNTSMRLLVTLDPMLDMNRNMVLKLEGIWW